MKNRSTVFNVVREEFTYNGDTDERVILSVHTVGTYRTVESADNIVAAYNQQVTDGTLPDCFAFSIQASVFYDE